MDDTRGLIFDIQGFSVHDGPGCRTQLFLSGCPLSCQWCANPEGMQARRQLLYSPQKCRFEKDHCRRCVKVCPHGAITITGSNPPLTFDRTVCRTCETFDCAVACCHEGVRVSGVYRTVDEVMRILKRDRQYWSPDGGVSFSGGEPMAQSAFLLNILRQCRQEGMHTAIETTASIETTMFLKIMEHIDFAFIDLKNMDSARHKEKTGLPNEHILHNVTTLVHSGWPGRVIIRMPVVRDFNDSDENAAATADFMNTLGLFEINLLPFHRLGTSKWEQLDKTYAYADHETTPAAVMERLQTVFLDKKIACYIGDDVYY